MVLHIPRNFKLCFENPLNNLTALVLWNFYSNPCLTFKQGSLAIQLPSIFVSSCWESLSFYQMGLGTSFALAVQHVTSSGIPSIFWDLNSNPGPQFDYMWVALSESRCYFRFLFRNPFWLSSVVICCFPLWTSWINPGVTFKTKFVLFKHCSSPKGYFLPH